MTQSDDAWRSAHGPIVDKADVALSSILSPMLCSRPERNERAEMSERSGPQPRNEINRLGCISKSHFSSQETHGEYRLHCSILSPSFLPYALFDGRITFSFRNEFQSDCYQILHSNSSVCDLFIFIIYS